MSKPDLEFVYQLELHSSGRCDDRRLLSSFLESTFLCQAPEHPGFLAVPSKTGPLIPIHTSEVALASHAGACRWFSTTGADLVALAPVGHRFVVDPGSPHQIVVDPNVFSDQVTGPAA